MPGAPMQTWNCSVSFCWKRRPGARLADERRPHARLPRGRLDALAGGPLEQAQHLSCSRLPAAASTTLPAT